MPACVLGPGVFIELAAFGSCSWQPEWCFELAVECCGAHDLRKSQPQGVSCENVSALDASRETVERARPCDPKDVSEAQRRSREVAGLVAFGLGLFCDALSVGEQRRQTRCNAASLTTEAIDVPGRTLRKPCASGISSRRAAATLQRRQVQTAICPGSRRGGADGSQRASAARLRPTIRHRRASAHR